MKVPVLWNPIVAKEYRSRMRTWRSPLAITIYIFLLGGLGWLLFGALSASASAGSIGPQAAGFGRQLFTFLIIFQLLLLAFITPALTAGAISGERERQTIDLLFCTRVKPVAIIWGKLLASMSFVLVLLILSVPIFSLVFLFGGIEMDQVLTAFLVTAVAALTMGALGIFFSTIAARTLPSTVGAYGAAFVLLFGTLLIATLRPTEYDPQRVTQLPAPPAISYLSPITALAAIVTDVNAFTMTPVPLPMVRARGTFTTGGSGGCYPVAGGGMQCYSTAVPLNAGGTIASPAIPGKGFVVGSPASPPRPGTIPSGPFSGWQYWQATIVLDLGLALVALVLSAIILPPVRRFQWRWLERGLSAARQRLGHANA